MKAKLEFNLPEDRPEFDMYRQAPQMRLVLETLEQHLRSKIKYEDLPATEYNIYDEIRDEFYRLMEHYDVTLD